MMHLRIVSPGTATAGVVDFLTDHDAVSDLVVVPGAALRPVGDLVLADIARESANEILDGIRALGVPRNGCVALEPVTTFVSRPAFETELRTPGSGADAVVWADVAQRSYADSELNWTFLTFLTLATVLAAIAVVTDSQILVIGAMVLGPEFGAVAALGVALVRRRPMLFGHAVRSLAVGFAVAIGITTALALVTRAIGWVGPDDVTGPRPETAFIYSPDTWSVVVAVIAGIAGVLSLTSSRVTALTGVFISVTTVPAAGMIALSLAFGAGDQLRGSAMQLGVNLVGMAIAGWLTLVVQQAVWSRVSLRRSRLMTVARRRFHSA